MDIMLSQPDADKDRNAYPLNRDILASARLHLQHRVWISSVGYHLHPSIELKENTLIADIGCGTGIWSLELAKLLPPSSRIEAYDLSLAQCPPEGWWPDNVKFDALNIFDPIPPHLLGRYDVVQLRHFICVVQSGNPAPLLKQLLKLLKPGGFLQWQEWDHMTNRIIVADKTVSDAAASAPKSKAFMDSIRSPGVLQDQVNWVPELNTRFEEAGAEQIALDKHWVAQDVMMLRQESSFMAAREWCENQRAVDPNHAGAARVKRLSDEARAECARLRRGAIIDTEMVTWVARKK